jgi:hypothetical protein
MDPPFGSTIGVVIWANGTPKTQANSPRCSDGKRSSAKQIHTRRTDESNGCGGRTAIVRSQPLRLQIVNGTECCQITKSAERDGIDQ